MGILIRVKNASFENNAVAFVPPVADGLEYLNFFSGGATNVARNLAPNKPNGALVGTPVYQANSTVFSGQTAYIETSVSDSPEMTMIAVARAVADSTAHIISSFSGPRANGVAGTSYGKTMWFTNPTNGDGWVQIQTVQGRWDGVAGSLALNTISGTLPINVNQWVAVTGLMGINSNQMRNNTTGHVDTDPTQLQTDPTSMKLRIGSATIASGSAEIAFAAVYNRLLSTDEVEKVYSFIKSYYARRGIAI